MKECKIILAVILLSVVLICSSCNKGTNQQKTTVANNISYAYDKEATISTENEKIVFSENGYYFIANANLYFYDMYNDITLPLCSKLDCNHVDSSCDSYISDTSLYVDEQGTIQSDGNSICLASTIWYDDGKLYMVQREDSGDYLMQYDKDYTNQVKLCQLALAGEETGAADPRPTAQMKMYNGYIYYFVTGYFEVPDMVDKDYMATIKCKRIKVEKGAQAETLGEFEFSADYTGFGASKANIAIGKDSIYFMICSQGRLLSDINPIRLKIFRYDIGDNDFKTVYEKESDDSNEFLGEGTGSFKYPICHNSCVDNDDNIYIVTDESNIVQISKDGTIKKIYDGQALYPYYLKSLKCDGEYLYFIESIEKKAVLTRIDKEGNVRGTYDIVREVVDGNKSFWINLLAIDKQNIIVSPDYRSDIKGLESEDYTDARISGVKNLSVPSIGIIPKEAFEDNSIPIKKIYEFKSE